MNRIAVCGRSFKNNVFGRTTISACIVMLHLLREAVSVSSLSLTVDDAIQN